MTLKKLAGVFFVLFLGMWIGSDTAQAQSQLHYPSVRVTVDANATLSVTVMNDTSIDRHVPMKIHFYTSSESVDYPLSLSVVDSKEILTPLCLDRFCKVSFLAEVAALSYFTLELPFGTMMDVDFLYLDVGNGTHTYTLTQPLMPYRSEATLVRMELVSKQFDANGICEAGEECWLSLTFNGSFPTIYSLDSIHSNCQIDLPVMVETPAVLFADYMIPVDLTALTSSVGCYIKSRIQVDEDEYVIHYHQDLHREVSMIYLENEVPLFGIFHRFAVSEQGVVSLVENNHMNKLPTSDRALVAWSVQEMENFAKMYGLMDSEQELYFGGGSFDILTADWEITNEKLIFDYPIYGEYLSICHQAGRIDPLVDSCVRLDTLIWEEGFPRFEVSFFPEKG